MKFDDLKQDIESFLGAKVLEEAGVLGNNQINNVAERELSGTDGIVFTDDLNHTQGMRDEVVKRFRDRYIDWHNKFESFKLKLKEIKNDNCSSKASIELSRLQKQKDDDIAAARETFERESDYRNAKKNKEETESRYDKMRKDVGGKPPANTPLWIYIPGILVVGIVEAFINFSTFDSKYGAPGLAMGMTLVVALVFAFASHFHGGYLKQRLALTGPDVQQRTKRHTYVVQAVVTAIFVLTVTGLMLVRYQVIQDEMTNMPSLGSVSLPGQSMETEQASTLELLMPTLLFNLGVWGLGIFISYLVHDARPDYKEAKKDYDAALKAFRHLDNQLNNNFEQIEAKFKKEAVELTNRIQMEEDIVTACEQLSQRLDSEHEKLMRATLLRINDGLKQYRNVFVTIAKQRNLAALKVGAHQLTLDAYLNSKIDIEAKHLIAA